MSDCLNYKVYCYTGPTGYKYIGVDVQEISAEEVVVKFA